MCREEFADQSQVRGKNAMARVGYLLISHVHPPQVVRLVRTLRTGDPDCTVAIHHDDAVSHLGPAEVERLGRVHVLRPPMQTAYGSFMTCELILRILRWMLRHTDCEWVTYLSGQDYPIKPPAQIAAELSAAEVDAFIDASPINDRPWFLGIERYAYQYYDLPALPGMGRVRKFLNARATRLRTMGCRLPRINVPKDHHGLRKIGIAPLAGPFGGSFRCHVGSAWWTISRRAAEHVVRFHGQHPHLANHYRRALFAPNESFFLTILANAPHLPVHMTDNRRFIRWSHPQTGHPDVLGAGDVEEMLASGCDFSRKVDSRKDFQILDLIDKAIGA